MSFGAQLGLVRSLQTPTVRAGLGQDGAGEASAMFFSLVDFLADLPTVVTTSDAYVLVESYLTADLCLIGVLGRFAVPTFPFKCSVAALWDGSIRLSDLSA